MQRQIRNALFVFSLITGTLCSRHAAASQTVSDENKSSDEALAEKVVAGDRGAIDKAGKSGNQFFVPYLMRLLASRKKNEGPSYFWPEELALARLGQQDQLQRFWSSALLDEPKRGVRPNPAVLAQVGGWFAIQGLHKLLTPEDLIKWHKPTRDELRSDTADLPVPVQAAITLSKAVPNSPVPATPLEALRAETQTSTYVKLWQDWIAAHRGELSALQPTGEGVEFSAAACKDGKPRN